jgi:hypothetical protein
VSQQQPLDRRSPLLLDTCVVQHLTWVFERQQEVEDWTDQRFAQLLYRYGQFAEELVALWELAELYEHHFQSTPPWLVSVSSREELSRIPDARRGRVLATWDWYHDNSEDWSRDSYQTVAPALLQSTPSVPNRLLLKGLGVDRYQALLEDGGPLASFPDIGDRQLVREALFAGVQTVLTTDLRTIWRYRQHAADLGILIVKPTELASALANR